MGMPPPIETANLGMADSLILMVMALVVFGPRRLPQIGRQIGKLMYEFRKASNDFKFQMEEELRSAEEADRLKKDEERRRTLALAAPPAQGPGTPANADSALPVPATAKQIGIVQPDSTSALPPDRQTHPLIQPPATGEQIPAARPARYTTQPDGAGEETIAAINPEAGVEANSLAEPSEEIPATQAEETPSLTEQTAHHG
jgi:sec-independent protein translocase protein TatB